MSAVPPALDDRQAICRLADDFKKHGGPVEAARLLEELMNQPKAESGAMARLSAS